MHELSSLYNALSDDYILYQKRLRVAGAKEDDVKALMETSEQVIMDANKSVYDATEEYCRRIKDGNSELLIVRGKVGTAMFLTSHARRVFDDEVAAIEKDIQDGEAEDREENLEGLSLPRGEDLVQEQEGQEQTQSGPRG